MGKKIKLKPTKIKKELGFNYSNWLYQSFGEKKVLICGEWTSVDTKMKLLVESVWKCCFQVSIRFHCWTTAVRIQSLTFAFWCFTDVLRICTNSLASLDWNTSETLTDIAFEAWQNLPHSGCNEFHASAVFVGQGLCHLSNNEISI